VEGFGIVAGSLARLADRGERFWVTARQRPRRPDSSELPSPLFYLRQQAFVRRGGQAFLFSFGFRCVGIRAYAVLKAQGEGSAHPHTDRE
jgi:hypothetical protein